MALTSPTVPLCVCVRWFFFFCLLLPFFGAKSCLSLCTSVAAAQPQSASCGLTSAKLMGWLAAAWGLGGGTRRRREGAGGGAVKKKRLHSEIAHTVQYGRSSC